MQQQQQQQASSHTCMMVFRASTGIRKMRKQPAASDAAMVLKAGGMSASSSKASVPVLAAVSPKRLRGPCSHQHLDVRPGMRRGTYKGMPGRVSTADVLRDAHCALGLNTVSCPHRWSGHKTYNSMLVAVRALQVEWTQTMGCVPDGADGMQDTSICQPAAPTSEPSWCLCHGGTGS
eukprot:1157594-Pelagomonas_calceolata.AAC.5